MTTNDLQSVATAPDGADKQPPEGKGAQGKGDDLDAILSEIEAEGKADDTPKKDVDAADEGKAAKADDPDLKAIAKSIYTREARRDLKSAIGAMRSESESLKGLGDDYIEGLMNVEAKRDPRIVKAWHNRETSPEAWERLLPVLGKKIAKRLGGAVDQQATEDREAVLAAVRGKSPGQGGAGTQVDLKNMNNAEFNAYKRSLLAKGR